MFSYLNNLLIWVWNNVIVQHFFRNVLSLRRLRHDLTKLSATKRAYDALLASKMGFYAHYSILLHNQRDMVIIFYPATSKSEIFFKKYSVHMHPRLEAILLPLVPMTLSVTCRTPTRPLVTQHSTKTQRRHTQLQEPMTWQLILPSHDPIDQSFFITGDFREDYMVCQGE